MKCNLFIGMSFVFAISLNSCGMRDYMADADSCKELVKEFKTEDVLIGRSSTIHTTDSLLFVLDHTSTDSIIHMFDAFTDRHIKSFGKFGQGPDEIARAGQFAFDHDKGEAYVFDYGQQRVMAFNIDSVVSDPEYRPYVKLRFTTAKAFPDRYVHINDSLGFARHISPGKTKGFVQSLCRYNLDSGTVVPFGDPALKCYENRSMFAVSPETNMVAEACSTQDLVIIYDFDGNVINRFEGPLYSSDVNRDATYFTGAVFAGDYLLCSYSGDTTGKEYFGPYIVVFDKKGDYMKTLDLGRKIINMSYSPAKGRLLIGFDDEMQFGELSLSEII